MSMHIKEGTTRMQPPRKKYRPFARSRLAAVRANFHMRGLLVVAVVSGARGVRAIQTIVPLVASAVAVAAVTVERTVGRAVRHAQHPMCASCHTILHHVTARDHRGGGGGTEVSVGGDAGGEGME